MFFIYQRIIDVAGTCEINLKYTLMNGRGLSERLIIGNQQRQFQTDIMFTIKCLGILCNLRILELYPVGIELILV